MIDQSNAFDFASLQDPTTAPRGVSKYEILRRNLAVAIDDGRLPSGTRVLAETELAAKTKFSLGTVQRALRELASEGYVVRRHGHGTFVADRRRIMASPLHSRFVDVDSGDILPVYTRVTGRCLETRKGPWSDLLGHDPDGILRLDRITDIDGRFHLTSRTYLPMTRFGHFMEEPIEKLDGRNLKSALYERHSLRVSKVIQRMRVAPVATNVTPIIGCREGDYGMEIVATGYLANDQAIYFQEIWVPPTEEALLLELVVGT